MDPLVTALLVILVAHIVSTYNSYVQETKRMEALVTKETQDHDAHRPS